MGRFALSAAEIAALARERQRLSLCATADTLAARQGRLADRAARVAAAFGVADLPVPTLGTTDRTDVESLQRFVVNATDVLGQAERRLTDQFAQLRRQAVKQNLRKVAGRAKTSPAPQPATDRVPHPAAAARSTEGPPAPPPDRTLARDIEAATDLLASLDDRVSDTSFPEHILQEIRSAPAGRRHLLLSALTAEVRDANEQVRQHAAVQETLAALAARAGQLDTPAPAAVVAQAVAAHTAGQPLDLARAEAVVSQAELEREQRDRLDRVRDLVAAEFAARGYTVLPGAEVFTSPFGLLLRSATRSNYGIGIDLRSDVISFTTVRRVDDAGEQRSGHDLADRERVCRDIGEVSAKVSGLTIEELKVVGDDVELGVPAEVWPPPSADPVASPRADQLPGY